MQDIVLSYKSVIFLVCVQSRSHVDLMSNFFFLIKFSCPLHPLPLLVDV